MCCSKLPFAIELNHEERVTSASEKCETIHREMLFMSIKYLSMIQDKAGRKSNRKMGHNSSFMIVSGRFSRFQGKMQKVCA